MTLTRLICSPSKQSITGWKHDEWVYPSTILRTAYRKQFYPKPMYRWKVETLKVCLFARLVSLWPGFGRYMPLKGAEKWSRDHQENWKLHIQTRRKIRWFQKCYFFDLRRKITKLSRKNRFRTVVCRQALVAFSARTPERSTEVGFSDILSI